MYFMVGNEKNILINGIIKKWLNMSYCGRWKEETDETQKDKETENKYHT